MDDHAGDRSRPYDRPVGAGVHETSIVSPDAVIGDGATIEPFCLIHECTIGAGAFIRSHTVVYADVEIGDDFECGHHVKIREGSRIGKGVRVGTDCDLQGLLTIGDYARLHSGVFVPQHTAIEELVWIFPRAVLLERSAPAVGHLHRGADHSPSRVIGAAATIFPGVEIGEGALVAAGSVVREDVARKRSSPACPRGWWGRRRTSSATTAASRACTPGGATSGGATPKACSPSPE